eukprot:c33017_g1_i1 orf=114-350(+)
MFEWLGRFPFNTSLHNGKQGLGVVNIPVDKNRLTLPYGAESNSCCCSSVRGWSYSCSQHPISLFVETISSWSTYNGKN